MPENIQVTRLRISHIAACIHDHLEEIGGPVAFAQRLASLEPVRGLEVTLPFGDGLRVDTDFWSRIAERPLSAPVPLEIAPKLRRAGVPLRCRGALGLTEETGRLEVPRLEAHLHPFGVVAMTTVDLTWTEPASLEQEVWRAVRELDDSKVVVAVDGQKRDTTLGRAAADAAEALVGLLTTDGRGEAWAVRQHRLATIISGIISMPPETMPAAGSGLHLALHRLSADAQVLAVPAPATAFVAQWNGAGYSWPADNLLYMLQSGTAVFSTEAGQVAPAGAEPETERRLRRALREASWLTPAGSEPSTADRHRLLLLELAYITALAGLVAAKQSSESRLFGEWAKTAANHLGRLFGPAEQYAAWGLVPQALMLRTNVSDAVRQVLGAGLSASQNYQVAKYP